MAHTFTPGEFTIPRFGLDVNLSLATRYSQNKAEIGASIQNMAITDVLCEGPIAGLVGGTSGVYLNDNAVEPEIYAAWNVNGGQPVSPIPSLAEIQDALANNPALASNMITISNTAQTSPCIGALPQGQYVPVDFDDEGREINILQEQAFIGTSAASVSVEVDSNTNGVVITIVMTNTTPFNAGFWQTKDNSSMFARLHTFFPIGNQQGDQIDCFGETTFVNSTTLKFRPYPGVAANNIPVDASIMSIGIYNTYPITEAVTGASTITIGANIPTGGYSFFVDKKPFSTITISTSNDSPEFIERFGLDIRAGKLEGQRPFNTLIDAEGGSSGIIGNTSSINLVELKQLTDAAANTAAATSAPGTAPIAMIDSGASSYPAGQSSDKSGSPTILSPPDFGLDTAEKLREADEIYFTIKYNSLQSTNLGESAAHEKAHAFYVMQVDKKVDGVWNNNFEDIYANYDDSRIIHSGNVLAPRSYEHRINLDMWRPFEDFKIRIIRLTRHIGLSVTEDGTNAGRPDIDKWVTQATGSIETLGAVIKDKFEFPGTAAAQVTFSSKQFQSTPKRSYHLRGKKVRIPTTYTPRELSDTGLAKYEDFWGGAFKYPFYTNNPAWIFLDLLTNARYGAGKWVNTSDIDIYALYRVSRYCDELVEDGVIHNVTDLVPGDYYKIKTTPADTNFTQVGASSGYAANDTFRATNGTPTSQTSGVTSPTGQVYGLEPRYRANIFLTRPTEVYKVIKDMASIFAGIIYYLDSKITTVQDVPQDPVYSFSQSNVIDGAFSYETTGSRTKVNQIIVTWNDPTINFTPVPLLVEDRESIARTGRIITENAVAFGCTSEGQATRLGKWKLWTAQNQTEVINFATGLQAAFLRPGDVINVSDQKRTGVSYSGRTSSATSTTITFDRSVNFNSGSYYELSTVVTKPATFYVGNSPITVHETPIATTLTASTTAGASTITVASAGAYTGYKVVGAGIGPNTTVSSISGSVITLSQTVVGAMASGDAISFAKPHTYYTGDRLPAAWVYTEDPGSTPTTFSFKYTNLLNEAVASNAFIDSEGSAEVQTLWKHHSFVETNPLVTPSSPQNQATLANSATFDDIPNTSTIWALKELNAAGEEQEGTRKLYKILSIAQLEPNTFSISAVEHYNEKYSEIEQRYQVGVTPVTIFKEVEDTVVPPPKSLIVTKEIASGGSFAVKVSWTSPEDYAFLDHFEVSHQIESEARLTPITTGDTSVTFTNVPEGNYFFQVRTVSSQGKLSTQVSGSINLADSTQSQIGTPSLGNITTLHGLPVGIQSTESLIFTNSSNTYGFEKANAVVSSEGNPSATTTISTQNIDVSGLSSGQTAYVIFDHSNSSIGLYEWNTTILKGVPFWRPIGNGAGGQTEFTKIIGVHNASDNVLSRSTIITKVDSISSLEKGDIIALEDAVPSTSSPSANAAKITLLLPQPNTSYFTLALNKDFGDDTRETNAWTPVYRPDPTKDAIVAQLEG